MLCLFVVNKIQYLSLPKDFKKKKKKLNCMKINCLEIRTNGRSL